MWQIDVVPFMDLHGALDVLEGKGREMVLVYGPEESEDLTKELHMFFMWWERKEERLKSLKGEGGAVNVEGNLQVLEEIDRVQVYVWTMIY